MGLHRLLVSRLGSSLVFFWGGQYLEDSRADVMSLCSLLLGRVGLVYSSKEKFDHPGESNIL